MSSSIVLPLLADYLMYDLDSTHGPSTRLLSKDYRLAFLFPSIRFGSLKDLNSPFKLLFDVVDMLPEDFSNVVISPQTAFCLSFFDIYIRQSHRPDAVRDSMKFLNVAHAYTIDDETGRTRPRKRNEFSLHPQLSKTFLALVKADITQLQPFFSRTFIEPSRAHLEDQPFVPVKHSIVDSSPFLSAVSLIPSTKSRTLTSNSMRLQTLPTPNTSVPCRKSADWIHFWRIPLTHQARNIWFRALHDKLPYRSRLHNWSPHSFLSPYCILCASNTIEDQSHFLFDCPNKRSVWEGAWISFFDSEFSMDAVRRAVLYFDYPRVLHLLGVPPAVCIGYTLLAIWRNHFSYIFQRNTVQPSKYYLICGVYGGTLL
jgi:hypothetical protein